MFQTKLTFIPGQAPEQRKAQAAYWRRQDAQRRGINDALGFWRVCGKPQCRRNQACSFDMHACFARHWAQVPEEDKEYLRGCITAARDGVRGLDALDRAGLAAREKYLDRMDRSNAPPATPAPAASPAPDVRIRRL